jgi:hypothetical protein
VARQIEQCEREGEKEEVDPHGMLGSIGSLVARVLGWKVSRGLILILKLIWIRMIMVKYGSMELRVEFELNEVRL